MKNYIKHFTAGVSIGLLLVTGSLTLIPNRASGLNAIVALGATNRTALLTNAVHINSITLIGFLTNVAACNFSYLDAPGNTNAHSANAISIAATNQAYTNYSVSIGGISNFYTNINGFIETNFSLGIIRTTNAVAAAYTAYRQMAFQSAMTNGAIQVLPITFGVRQFNEFGLVLTNSAPSVGVVVSIDYDNAR